MLSVNLPVGDRNSDGQIGIDELIAAVRNAISGCPAPPVFVAAFET